MKIILKTIPLLILTIFVIWYGNANGNGVLSPLDGEGSVTVTFDFDTGSPALVTQASNTPFEQTVGDVTAQFSSLSDSAAFSVENHDTTFFMLSQFSGNYMYPNRSSRTNLHIRFSRTLVSIALTFATIEYHGVGEVDEPTTIKLTACMDSTGTSTVGSATARGVFPEGYAYPQGTLSFNSGDQPFNMVETELLYQQKGATSFRIDQVVVTTSPQGDKSCSR